jgi:hypothetical protein
MRYGLDVWMKAARAAGLALLPVCGITVGLMVAF